MRLVRLRAPGGLENLKLVEEDHAKPRPGELLVRIRASSLNFDDDLVVLGKIPCADGRIPMSDGAGEVIAVGDDVDEFKVADTVVSTFWPYWLGGDMTPATKRDSSSGRAGVFQTPDVSSILTFRSNFLAGVVQWLGLLRAMQ